MSRADVHHEPDRPARRRRSDGERSRNAILQRGRAARHRRGHRRALDRPAGRRRRDEQERPLRPLRLQGGAPARDDRDGERALRRAGGRARVGAPRPGSSGCSSSRRASCGTSRATSSRAAASSPRSRPRWTRTPGPVRDLAVQRRRATGSALLETAVGDAQAEGAIDPAEDAAPARLRARRLPAPRQRAVRRQSGTPTPIDARASRSGVSAFGSGPRLVIIGALAG